MILYYTIQNHIILYYIILYYILLRYIILYYYYIILYYIILYYIILYYNILYYIILHYIILYYVILYYIYTYITPKQCFVIFASSIWWSEMVMQIRAFTDSLLHVGIVLPGTKASMLQIQRSLNRFPWRHGMLDPNDLKMGTQQGEWFGMMVMS